MPRSVKRTVAGAPTSAATAPPGSLQYPNRRWVRHAPLRGEQERRCGCDCQPHATHTLHGRLCAGVRGVIYGTAYHCDECDDDLCAAWYSAGYAHLRHRRSHALIEVAPPPPSLQPLPGQTPLSAPPPSPRSLQLRGVQCVRRRGSSPSLALAYRLLSSSRSPPLQPPYGEVQQPLPASSPQCLLRWRRRCGVRRRSGRRMTTIPTWSIPQH